VSIRRKMFGL